MWAKWRRLMYDVVTLGETMIRLTPPGYERLEQARSYDVTVGGSESSCAIAMARLGLRVAWVSKLPQNPLGRLVANKVREHGVDTSYVIWAKDARVGIYFFEIGSSPRASQVIYDRKGSAFSTLSTGDVNWKEVFGHARMFHTSGITPALSKSCAESTKEAIIEAKQAGCIISFDLNYRSKLWSPEEARECFSELLEYVNIAVTGIGDATEVFGLSGRAEDIAEKMKSMFHLDAIAVTTGTPRTVKTGTFSSILLADKFYYGKEYDLEVVDRLGMGDSFTAGFLYGYLSNDMEKGIAYGNAMAALEWTFPGDITWVSEEDILNQIRGQSVGVKR